MPEYDEHMSDEEARNKIEDESYGGALRKVYDILKQAVDAEEKRLRIEATYGRDVVGKRAEQMFNDDTVELN